MKKSVKIISTLLVVAMLFMAVSPICFAAGMLAPAQIKPNYDGINTTEIQTTAGKILGLIRNIAVIAGVILIGILGLKYMIGSTEEKAEYKKSFMPLIIGAVVVMSAVQIATMIFTTFSSAT